VAYRFIRDVAETTDVSFTWPLLKNWRAVGRWNYALDEETTLEGFAGFEYESCCWGFRTVVRRYLSSSRGDHTNGIFFQLELKGLTGIGRGTSEFLQKNIPGYKNEF
jgi:LPS-assembly protein